MALPQYLLMDLGGVMCEFRSTHRLDRFARLAGITQDEVREAIYGSDRAVRADTGEIGAATIRANLLSALGPAFPAAEFDAAWASAFAPSTPVLALVGAVRRRLDAPRVGLFTNNDALLRDVLPAELPEVDEQVDTLLFSCDLGAMKPDRRVFERVLARINVPAERVVFVDDSGKNVGGAAEVGIDSILFTGAEALADEFRVRGLVGNG
ncbi:MAG: HAD family hydrolase [Frankia sp.]